MQERLFSAWDAALICAERVGASRIYFGALASSTCHSLEHLGPSASAILARKPNESTDEFQRRCAMRRRDRRSVEDQPSDVPHQRCVATRIVSMSALPGSFLARGPTFIPNPFGCVAAKSTTSADFTMSSKCLVEPAKQNGQPVRLCETHDQPQPCRLPKAGSSDSAGALSARHRHRGALATMSAMSCDNPLPRTHQIRSPPPLAPHPVDVRRRGGPQNYGHGAKATSAPCRPWSTSKKRSQ